MADDPANVPGETTMGRTLSGANCILFSESRHFSGESRCKENGRVWGRNERVQKEGKIRPRRILRHYCQHAKSLLVNKGPKYLNLSMTKGKNKVMTRGERKNKNAFPHETLF